MSEFARALGTEEEITFEGKTYKKSAMTLDVIADFEVFLENRAFEALERRRLHVPPQEYDKRYAALLRDVAAGSYGFLSETGQQVYTNSLTDPSNQAGIELLYLRLMYGNPGDASVTRDLAKRYIESNFEKMLESLMRENIEDPNSQGPSPTAGGDDSESKPSSPDSQENPSTSPLPNAAS